MWRYHITHKVLKKGKNSKLKVISKYGTGLDRIDLKSTKSFKIPVLIVQESIKICN